MELGDRFIVPDRRDRPRPGLLDRFLPAGDEFDLRPVIEPESSRVIAPRTVPVPSAEPERRGPLAEHVSDWVGPLRKREVWGDNPKVRRCRRCRPERMQILTPQDRLDRPPRTLPALVPPD